MKYALVTGGSTGIGKAIAISIAMEHGYHVLVNYYKNGEVANEVVSLIRERSGSAEAIQFDVTDKSDVATKLNNWSGANNDAVIEVLINNAGLIRDDLLMFMNEEKWDMVVDVKLKGFYNVTSCVIQKMLLNRYGRIVNIASLRGIYGARGQVNYSAANGGLIAASNALAKETGGRNITVNAVAPGFIRTALTVQLPEEELKKIIPAGRFGTPEEIADLVSFLVSRKAAYINGAVIPITGGL
ncbi:MAG TPA: SDR family oxidoreductase [Chitinophagaceae bacterium]|nr:SDR family oxidoreductase [Chitinophagaceae bacterium]